MVHDRVNWLMRTRRGALALIATGLSVGCLAVPQVQAQGAMRSPNLNIQSRMPTINPVVTPRVDPNIAGRTTPNISSRIGVTSTLPNARFSPNATAGGCTYAYRSSDGECREKPVTSSDSGGAGGKSANNKKKNANAGGNAPQTALKLPAVVNELVAEI